jgi:outer membrane protein assembly factor BamB
VRAAGGPDTVRPTRSRPVVIRPGARLLPLFMITATLSAAGQGPAIAPAGEWRQFRGTPRLTGVSASNPPASLKLLWTFDAGDVIDSSAAIADGVVYVGGGDGDLFALDLAAGTPRWKYTTGNLIGESSPAVGADAVYVGDLDGVLHAVNIKDGKRLWTFKTGSEIKSSPVVVPIGTRNSGNSEIVLIGSYDGHLYGLEARTGRVRWKVLTKGQVHATPAVQDGLAFIAGCDAIFRAIRVTDGRQMYQVESGAYTAASPVVEGNRAYFGTFNYELLALDLTRRTVLWRYFQPDAQFPYYSSAALSDGRVIVGGRDKMVHAIDTATGKAAWTFATRARVDSSPVVAAGRVYVGSSDGRLYVLDAASGQKLSEFDTGAAITASPAIAGGRVVIGSQDGLVYVFG